MSEYISSRINLTISVATQGVAAQNLETPLLLGYHTRWADLTREYRSTTGMISDGFVATDPLVLMAQQLKAQNPCIETFKVGRRATAFTHDVDLEVMSATGTIAVTITKGAVSRTYSQTGGGVDEDTEATALAAAMNADTSGWGTSGDASALITASLHVVNLVANTGHDGDLWYYSALTQISIDDTTADPGLAADIAAIQAVDDDWYACTLDSCSGAEGAGLAAALSDDEKLVLVGCQDSDIPASGSADLAGVLAAAAYDNAACIYSPHSMREYPACAILGKCLAYAPGSAIWDLKQVVGVTAADLTQTQIGYLDGKNCNYYVSYVGIGGVHQHGKTAGGDVVYLEIRHLVDYLVFRIREELMTLLLSTPKLPYLNRTLILVKGAIFKVLKAAERVGGVQLMDDEGNSTFSFSYTPVEDQLEADELAGILRGIEWACPIVRGVRKFYIVGQLVGA